MRIQKKTVLVVIVFILLIIALDQGSKWLVSSTLPRGDQITVIPGFFNVTHIRNPGAAFGILSHHEFPGKRFFFIGVTVVAIVFITAVLIRSAHDGVLVVIGLTCVVGGAVGNLIDRVFREGVVDFIELYYKRFHWPAFNIADSCISAGIVLLLLDFLFHHRSHQHADEIGEER